MKKLIVFLLTLALLGSAVSLCALAEAPAAAEEEEKRRAALAAAVGMKAAAKKEMAAGISLQPLSRSASS